MIRGCRFEDDVRAAAVANRWTDDLQSHAASCGACADVALVTTALHDGRPVPIIARDASVIWICAKHARRLMTEARLSFAMMATTTIAATVVLAVVLSFVDWRGFWATVTRAELGAATGVTAAAGMIIAAAMIRVRRFSTDG